MTETGSSDDFRLVESEFYKWVGLNLAEWAKVEARLFRICTAALATDQRRAAVVFYKTPNLSQRLELTSELIGVLFPAPERKNGGHRDPRYREWIKLVDLARKLMPVRNNIAHNEVIWAGKTTLRVVEEEDGTRSVHIADRVHQRFELRKHATKLLRENEANSPPLTTEGLKDEFWKVNKLAWSLHEFAVSLEPQPEPGEPVTPQ